jgi:hypothetical protein
MSDEKNSHPLPIAALLDTIQQLMAIAMDQQLDLAQFTVRVADKDGELFNIEQMHVDVDKKVLYLVRAWTTNEEAVYDKALAEQIAKTDNQAQQAEQNAAENEKLADDDSAWEDPTDHDSTDEDDDEDDNWDD